MSWRPELNVTCGRCGKPRGVLGHVCVSGRSFSRKATLKPKVTFGTCPKCKKPQGNPLTHTCHPRSDFKRRQSAYAKAERAKARKKRQKTSHDYQACADNDCPRPLCVAFKTGYQTGNRDGYEHGWRVGYDAGIAACPRQHR